MHIFRIIATLVFILAAFPAWAMEPLTIHYSANTYGVISPCPS
ncbi:MAG TPA: hypothetical protein VJ934_07265 [Desulfomicrobiaceae bacterium]|nr:hypothetical protein [Desulfomicrobiaceae bacterium]